MAQSKTLLIVNHEARPLADMARALRSAGYDVLEARKGSEGLRLAEEMRPDLMLVHAALPDVSGIDLLREMRRDPSLAGLYVGLLMPDDAAPTVLARALEYGADAVMPTVMPTREMLARVQSLLRRQEVEEGLSRALQKHRATFDAMNDAMYLVDTDWKIVDCNDAMAKFLGRPRTDLVGGYCYELVHGTGKPIPACLGQRVRQTQHHENLVVPMEDRWLQVEVDPLFDAEGQVIGSVHMLRDITEQQLAQQVLRETQAELQVRTDEVQAAVARAEAAEEAQRRMEAEMALRAEEHRLALAKAREALQAEAEARERTQGILLGTQAQLELETRERRQAEMARQSAEETLRRVQRELHTVAARAADVVYTCEVESGRLSLVSDTHGFFASAAHPFPATLGELQEMVHPEDRARVVEGWERARQEGGAWEEECRVVLRDGQVVHWSLSAAPLAWEGEGPGEWVVTARDVTAQKRAEQERERATAQRHLADKMAALQRLAQGMASDFNRSLAVILGGVELALSRMGPSHPLYGELQEVRKAGQQAAALVRRLLAFAGREVLELRPLDCNEVVRGMEPRLRRALGERVALELKLAVGVKPVLADAEALEQVVLGLAEQARAAVGPNGTVQVRTAPVTLTEAYRRSQPLAKPGEYVRLTVAHAAEELTPEALEDVFEPQFGGEVSGQGLGLALVYGLVGQLGGFVEVRPSGAGETAWEVYLPVYVEPEPEAPLPVEDQAAAHAQPATESADLPVAQPMEPPGVETAGEPEVSGVQAVETTPPAEGESDLAGVAAGSEEVSAGPQEGGAVLPLAAVPEQPGREPEMASAEVEAGAPSSEAAVALEERASESAAAEGSSMEPSEGADAQEGKSEETAPPPAGLAERLRSRFRRVRG